MKELQVSHDASELNQDLAVLGDPNDGNQKKEGLQNHKLQVNLQRAIDLKKNYGALAGGGIVHL